MKYINNFTGHKWTESRKLTTELLNQFSKDVKLNNHNAWKNLAEPNGDYCSIRQRIILHNHKVRTAWDNGVYNKKERVLEGFVDYHSNTLRIQHVDIDAAVKEKAFYSEADRYGDLYRNSRLHRLFGDSELEIGSLDKFNFEAPTYADYCAFIDIIHNIANGMLFHM